MSDLYGWILEQISTVEEVARDATAGPWGAVTPEESWGAHQPTQIIGQGKPLATMNSEYNGPLNADHIALHSPDAVLRRCAADRKLLEVHRPQGGDWDPYACEGCGYDGSYCPELSVQHTNDCPVLLAIAEGYGLTPEILGGLDRPAPVRLAKSQSVLPKELAEAWGAAIMQSLQTTAVLPPPSCTCGAPQGLDEVNAEIRRGWEHSRSCPQGG